MPDYTDNFVKANVHGHHLQSIDLNKLKTVCKIDDEAHRETIICKAGELPSGIRARKDTPIPSP
jgi:hypothetical protein